MKIMTLAVAATAFLHLKGPDGAFLYEGEGAARQAVGIDIFSPGSPEFASIEERTSARAIRRYQDNDGKLAHVPVDERRAETAEDLATVTVGFRHIDFDGPDGQPLTGRELFIAVYSEPKLGWIKDQASKFIGNWGKFAPASPTS